MTCSSFKPLPSQSARPGYPPRESATPNPQFRTWSLGVLQLATESASGITLPSQWTPPRKAAEGPLIARFGPSCDVAAISLQGFALRATFFLRQRRQNQSNSQVEALQTPQPGHINVAREAKPCTRDARTSHEGPNLANRPPNCPSRPSAAAPCRAGSSRRDGTARRRPPHAYGRSPHTR